MNPELWQRLKPLYDAALDLPQDGRTGMLEKMCGQDEELASELQALLLANQNAANTLDSPFTDLSLFLPRRPPCLEPGTLLAGRFRVKRHLGSGGMGDVYEALDEQMEHGRIALKTLRPAIAENAAALARFKDEVRLARKVSGPNVCRIHELYLPSTDPHAQGSAFLTMELLEGVTLHDRIAGANPLPVAEIRRLAEQLCDALCCIHEAGVVHQDLKPRNVMLVPHNGAERVVVTDFGLARAATKGADGADAASLAPGLVAGTPAYMAPEQFEGGEVGPTTDVYALGLLLYEMSTGVQPFAANTPLAAAIRRGKRPLHASSVRPDLPPAWDNVIGCCLKYEPEQRYQTAAEVKAAFTHPHKVVLRLGQQHRLTLPLPVLATCALALLLLLGLGGWLHYGRPRHRVLAPDAARWYAMGMTALREGSYLKATRLLTMVTQRDPTYALAHAALADAWAELDYTESAQREMLLASAPEERSQLSDLDQRYIDAVRRTLVRDYSAAAQDYEAILKKLPDDSKAQGYVDLGRIYEKAGKVKETVASYEKAARLNPDDPAPFLHLGILKSRLRDRDGATRAFATSDRLYDTESNLEGLAEVAYQRGYAANDAEATAEANQNLEKSLAIARQIPSMQLQVRSLSQLSSVAYNSNKDDQAIAYATQVIQLARENGLEYWVTDGMVRMGNALLDKEQYDAADAPLQEALRRAQESGHPRLEATAQLTLASLRFQQQRWEENIHLAQQSLKYFQDYGFLDLADQALLLTARAQRNSGNYTEALKAGEQLLRTAQLTKSIPYMFRAEELVASVLFRLQRYPEVLPHVNSGLEQAAMLKQNAAYLQLSRADVLGELGRYDEALAELSKIGPEARNRLDIGAFSAAVSAKMRLSQGNATAALTIVEKVWSTFSGLKASAQPINRVLLRTAALSEIELGHGAQAQEFVSRLIVLDQNKAEAWERTQTELVQAMVDLYLGNTTDAKAHALNSEAFFASSRIQESDALSCLVAAEAAEAAGEHVSADGLSRKSVDIFRGLAQSWGTPIFREYLARPDRQKTWRALSTLRAANGDKLDAVFQ